MFRRRCQLFCPKMQNLYSLRRNFLCVPVLLCYNNRNLQGF